MKPIPRNVILDLLPGYLAGEASDESRALVEQFAQDDPEIARLIQAGQMCSDDITPEISPPPELEMKTIKRIRGSIRRRMVYVAMATVALLMVPLVAMQFTSEVNWDLTDFLVMGTMLFGAGLAYVLISRLSDTGYYRTAIGLAIVSGFLLIWMNLAVGLIGKENHPANLLYAVVLLVGIIGAGKSRFQAGGMAVTMFTVAVVQLLVPVAALIIWRPAQDDPAGMVGIFLLNGFFAALFAVSGLLFKRGASGQ